MKKLNFILALLLILTFSFFALASGEESDTKSDDKKDKEKATEKNESTLDAVEELESIINSVPDDNDLEDIINSVTEDSSSESENDSLTIGQQNALDKADSYLSFMAFSKTGLIEQLEFEGFTTEDATFAVENCGADWNEQAAKKAESYLEFSSFSRDGLIDQLIFEGFTEEQAEYGVTAVGY